MSLIVYKNNPIPKDIEYVNINDSYFNLYTKLDNSKECAKILREIDSAEYSGPNMFIGRDKDKGSLYKENLSTGCKTALNVLKHPDICFDLTECGNNAINVIFDLNKGIVKLNGSIFFTDVLSEDIDIIIDGTQIKTTDELSIYLEECDFKDV